MTDDLVARLRNRIALLGPSPDQMVQFMDGIIPLLSEAATVIESEHTLRAQAEQEHTDMMWQRRRADERSETAEACIRELEAENKRLAERLDLLAVGFGVPDGGRYIADWQTKIEKLKAAERALAEAYERAAEVADRPVIGFSDGAVEAARYIAAAIRKLAQEVKHEAE